MEHLLPAGYVLDDAEVEGPPLPCRWKVGEVVDSGRRKPIARTLQQAFPMSEGYRQWCYMTPPRTPLTERVSWAAVIGLALWVVLWAIQHRPAA